VSGCSADMSCQQWKYMDHQEVKM